MRRPIHCCLLHMVCSCNVYNSYSNTAFFMDMRLGVKKQVLQSELCIKESLCVRKRKFQHTNKAMAHTKPIEHWFLSLPNTLLLNTGVASVRQPLPMVPSAQSRVTIYLPQSSHLYANSRQ